MTGTRELQVGTLARTGGHHAALRGRSLRGDLLPRGDLVGGRDQPGPRLDGRRRHAGGLRHLHGTPPPSPHPQLAACRPCPPADHRRERRHRRGRRQARERRGGPLELPPARVDRANPARLRRQPRSRELSTCHGADLAGGTSGLSCDACHQPGWRTTCTFCHGDAARASGQAAPPVGTQGQALTTDRAVGAHARHVLGSAHSPPIACAECHVTPTDLAHVNGTPALTWGAMRHPDRNRSGDLRGTTCSNYCHGASLAAGGSNTTPAWTVVNGTQAACGTCHGAPPPLPHPQNPPAGTATPAPEPTRPTPPRT